jgi:hypothetical protein
VQSCLVIQIHEFVGTENGVRIEWHTYFLTLSIGNARGFQPTGISDFGLEHPGGLTGPERAAQVTAEGADNVL